MSRLICLIIILTTFAPCMDSSAIAQPTPKLSYNTTTDGREHQPVKDGCSPFCMCACCSVPTSIQHTKITLAASQQQPITYAEKTFGKAIGAELSVWQPPQLG